MKMQAGFLKIIINRNVIFFVVPLAAALMAASYFALKAHTYSARLRAQGGTYEKFNKENVELRDAYVTIKNDYEKIKKDYDNISADRDNLLIQIKKNVADVNRLAELEAATGEFTKEKDGLESEKLALLNQNADLKEKIDKLQGVYKQALDARDALSEELVRAKDASGKMVLEQQNAELTRRLAAAQEENGRLQSAQSATLKQALDTVTTLKASDAQLQDKVKEYQLHEKELTKKYAEAVKKTKSFEAKVARDPAKFTEIARQNKALIRDTSTMHYNMGVFYLKQKEYSRAVAEFEKAVELTPDDAYAHFNLGYMYAEYLVNRKKAVEHFRHYLRVAKSDDKDVDWVKKYILTWETWQAQQPMK
ncbi:MAG: tetratricopeptide repeat protein [Candidatus Omnitrophota bacterium]|nr:tetratricopeptide repeat protein [Candidatus Omnitrophota bacterium]